MIRVNAERLWSTLEIMAQIGGTPAGGVTRLALSNEDRLARDLLPTGRRKPDFAAKSIAWATCLFAAPVKNHSLRR